MTTDADLSVAPPAPACPICGKPATAARLMPFCSARCADVDLGRWLTGQYRVAGPAAEDELPDEAASDGSA